ncbi:MAG: hypothetical protein U9O59_07070, partial [Actinomycetota bacterium]|nr:hypothetical protein [Actinomycetota bacterium]
IESIFSCFCKYCAEKFYNRYGLSLKKYKIKIRDFLDNFKEITDRDIKNWYDFKYIWKLSGIEKFVDFKSFSIYNTVKMFSDYARSKSMIVGGDLYTYSMSPVVFQDYNLLQECFDWIKPMMYCHTYGPAGIPLEILCLSRAFKALNYKLKEKSILEFFENIMGVELPKSLRSLTEKGIAEEFVSVELDKIEKLGLSERVDIYPGFEAMRMPGVCIINKTILNSYIDKINKKVKGFIVSWNLLDIPESNLKFINKRLQ